MRAIVTHRQADFDALGALVAARLLFPDAKPVLDDGNAAVDTYLAWHREALGLLRSRDLDWEQVDRIVYVDGQDPARAGGLPSKQGSWSWQVIDHHPDLGLRLGVEQIEPVGAATTLVVEQLQAHGIVPSSLEATTMALGIYADTGGLLFPSATARDAAAFSWLMSHGPNQDVLRQYARAEMPIGVRAILERLLVETRPVVVAGHAGVAAALAFDTFVTDAAVAVEHWADLTGKNLAVAALQMGHHTHLIARSGQPGLNLVRALAPLGAKGHTQACYAKLKDTDAETALANALRLLAETLPPAPTARQVMTSPVLTIGPDTTVKEAAELLRVWGHSTLPIITADERPIGLVSRSETDKALRHGLGHAPVKAVMRAATAIPVTTPQGELPALLAQAERHRLLVTEDDRLIGVIAGTDLVKRLYGQQLGLPSDRPSATALADRLTKRLDPATLAVLRQAGDFAARYGVGLYWVGGSVRDLLVERDAPPDVDLVVDGDGVAFARAWAEATGFEIQVHERFGTAKLATPAGPLDIASSRREYYPYPGAQPEVQFCPIAHDLARRDFTINALAIRLDPPQFGQLLDFFGGWQDLQEGRLRVLHPLSYLEDPSRLWRAVRFEFKLGFRLAETDEEQIRATMAAEPFERYANHRIAQEMRQLWSNDVPAWRTLARLYGLGALRPFGVRSLARLEDEFRAFDEIRALLPVPEADVWLGYVALLVGEQSEDDRRQLLAAMKLGAGEQERIEACWQKMHEPPPSDRVALYEWGDRTSPLTLAYAAAISDAEGRARIVRYWQELRPIRPSLDGGALAAMGFRPGPLFGKVLTAVLRAKIAGDVTTPDEERQLAVKLAAEENHAD